jgi:8-oxo-dGTP pyrophosphatase MutT (NUDIX family)
MKALMAGRLPGLWYACMASERDTAPLDETACRTIGDVMRHQTRTTAILVFNKLGHVLLQKRDHLPTIREPGKWDVWGGHCEEGETPKACAVRELREEIGVEMTDTAALKFLMTRPVEGQEESVFAYLYEADGTPPVYEGERAAWFTPEAAASLSMAFGAETLFSPDTVTRAKATLALQ